MNGLSWEDDGAQEGLLTRRSAQNCLTEHELEEFLFNRLSGVTREVIEEHLLVCPNCQDRVEAEAIYSQAFQDAAKQVEAEDFTRAMGSVTAEPQAGWRESLLAGWTALFGKRTILALAGAGVVTAALFYSTALRRPGQEATVELSLARGEAAAGALAPVGRALTLSADVSQLPVLPNWQVEVVDATGRLEQSAQVAAAGGRLSWVVKDGLPAGRHWVRLRAPGGGSLVREYGVVVR
ncbi:MAG: zf-HC2 domain-containing protein [Bryobacterales bacterium]|nr:zf-HC2 domain-containing protein [Bryobacterales bacterium]